MENELKQQTATDADSLIRLLASQTNSGVRWMAIEVVGLRGDVKATNALRQVLASDPDPLLRETAALALARLHDASGMPALRKVQQDSASLERQIFLASRLAEFGDASGYSSVVKGARSEQSHLRYLAAGAAVALAPFQDKRNDGTLLDPTGLLVTLAQDPEAKVRKEVIAQMPSGLGKGLSEKILMPVLEKIAKEDEDAHLREQAQLLLKTWK